MTHIAFNNTKVAEGGDTEPLPDNTKVLATLLATRKDGHVIEKRPFANQGVNSTITALGARFRIDNEQKGAGRNVFADIPLARNLNTTAGGKFPDGTPAYFFFQFFRALGYDVDQETGFDLPSDPELLGEKFELVLSVDVDSNDKPVNRVKFINKANGIPVQSAQAAKASTQPAATWKPGAVEGVAATPATTAPTTWTPGAAQTTATPPAQWAPAAADVAYAEAAGKTY